MNQLLCGSFDECQKYVHLFQEMTNFDFDFAMRQESFPGKIFGSLNQRGDYFQETDLIRFSHNWKVGMWE